MYLAVNYHCLRGSLDGTLEAHWLKLGVLERTVAVRCLYHTSNCFHSPSLASSVLNKNVPAFSEHHWSETDFSYAFFLAFLSSYSSYFWCFLLAVTCITCLLIITLKTLHSGALSLLVLRCHFCAFMLWFYKYSIACKDITWPKVCGHLI